MTNRSSELWKAYLEALRNSLDAPSDLSSLFEIMKKALLPCFEYLSDTEAVWKSIEKYSKTDEVVEYDQVKWIIEDQNWLMPEAAKSLFLNIKTDNDSVLADIQRIARMDILEDRDKLILILGYLEPLVRMYLQELNIEIKDDNSLTCDKTKKAMHSKVDGKAMELCVHKLFTICAIIFIIYKDCRHVEGDKKLPHRNQILHSGIKEYNQEEIASAYNTLIAYIYIMYKYTRELGSSVTKMLDHNIK